jgi:hypothetical protein
LEVTGLSGAAGNTVTIRGESPGSVIFDGGCPEFPCSENDVVWQWDDETGVVSIKDSRFVTLQDISVQNAIAAGISLVGGTKPAKCIGMLMKRCPLLVFLISLWHTITSTEIPLVPPENR